MDIETKIALGFLFAFAAGIVIGWYATWQTYHQNKAIRTRKGTRHSQKGCNINIKHEQQ